MIDIGWGVFIQVNVLEKFFYSRTSVIQIFLEEKRVESIRVRCFIRFKIHNGFNDILGEKRFKQGILFFITDMIMKHFNLGKDDRRGIRITVYILETIKNVLINVFLIVKPKPYTITDGGDSIDSPSFNGGVMKKGCISILVINQIDPRFHGPKIFFFNQ